MITELANAISLTVDEEEIFVVSWFTMATIAIDRLERRIYTSAIPEKAIKHRTYLFGNLWEVAFKTMLSGWSVENYLVSAQVDEKSLLQCIMKVTCVFSYA